MQSTRDQRFYTFSSPVSTTFDLWPFDLSRRLHQHSLAWGVTLPKKYKLSSTFQYWVNEIRYVRYMTDRTRKPSCRWQTHATRKHAKNCSNSTCWQRCRWQWSIFIRLAVAASEIYEIPRNSLKIQTYRVQGHPRSSILVSIESA